MTFFVAVSDSTTLPSCLRQATVSAAQGKRRLGQEMARSMCHFQARKWQRNRIYSLSPVADVRRTTGQLPQEGAYHEEFSQIQEAFARPLPTNLLLRKIFAGALSRGIELNNPPASLRSAPSLTQGGL